MSGLLFLFFAALLTGGDSQTLSTTPVDDYTALVPVNIKCRTDPIKGLTCNAEYPDQCKEQWNFPNPCTPANLHLNVTKFIHPFDTTKFLMCGDLGKLYVVQCPQYEVFHKGCGQCVGKGTGFDASCEIPLTPMIKNPCTSERILANKLFFPFPGDLGKFIHCDVWGKAWERTCTVNQVWSQYEVACVSPSVLNPCTKSTTDVNFLYTHPCDPYKYIRCDTSGVAYEVVCPSSTSFVEAVQGCQPLGRLSYKPEIICGTYQFGFLLYRDIAGQQGQIGGPGDTSVVMTDTRAGVGMRQSGGQVRANVGGTGNELNVIMDVWKASVNGGTVGGMPGNSAVAFNSGQMTSVGGALTGSAAVTGTGNWATSVTRTDLPAAGRGKEVHPSLIKDYAFSHIRWAEPCTKDNVQYGRWHFKLTGDPHHYIQCDAHGMMYKMPCAKDGIKQDYFDVYTSTCVDGPVHIPSERLMGDVSAMGHASIQQMSDMRPGGIAQMTHMMSGGTGQRTAMFSGGTGQITDMRPTGRGPINDMRPGGTGAMIDMIRPLTDTGLTGTVGINPGI